MGRRVKQKGTSGAAKNFLTRNQAIKKLQLSLPEFRRICIWKGIYPREPRSRTKASGRKGATKSTTFYYARDIQYLLHEPIINKFREQKVLEKKIAKALGRGNFSDAARVERNAVGAGMGMAGREQRRLLARVMRERYPTLIDAVRDLDDCLSMLFLFAELPSTTAVPAATIERCKTQCLRFQHYVIRSRSLTKSFLSIKGIYYQAEIMGEEVTWVVPHKFKINTAGDVDFRIMGTFVEFYLVMVNEINGRLYRDMGLTYPPTFDAAKADDSAELGAFNLQGIALPGVLDQQKPKLIEPSKKLEVDPEVQAKVDKIFEDRDKAPEEPPAEEAHEDQDVEEPSTGLAKFPEPLPGGDYLPQPEPFDPSSREIFANCTFFLSRETPRHPLEFILKAFGCRRVGWDAVGGAGAYTTDEFDPSITHQIVDRPPLARPAIEEGGAGEEKEEGEDNQTKQRLGFPHATVPDRYYVQPQWVWDCINDKELKPADLYAPGEQLPPHYSPFVSRDTGRYDPEKPIEEQLPEGTTLEDHAGNDEDVPMADGEEAGDFGGFSDGDGDEMANEVDGSDEDEDEDEDDDVGDSMDHDGGDAAVEEANLAGEFVGKATIDQATKVDLKARARESEKQRLLDDKERAKGMLSKKKRRLFEQMEYTNHKKQAEDDRLIAKRARLEATKRRH